MQARLEAATKQLAEIKVETTAAAQAEREATDASAKAWSAVTDANIQLTMSRVRAGTAGQHAEAEARAARQRAAEEERLRRAQARMKEAQEGLVQSARELALCEAQERSLDELLAQAAEKAQRAADAAAPPVTSEDIVLGLHSVSEAGEATVPHPQAMDPTRGQPSLTRGEADANLSSQIKEAQRTERIARARGKLVAERARRVAALAQQREAGESAARVRVEAARAQLAAAEVEAAAAARAEKDAAEASAQALSQVLLEREMTGTVEHRAEVEARAAQER